MLFSTTWRRIILDEGMYEACPSTFPPSKIYPPLAHVIRNVQSQISKSVCALSATARWAVTGTPIQNRVGDLAALLKFIRAYPYDDIRQFDTDIGKIWKTGDVEEAAQKLKKLSASLILRRPKTVIELPPRIDLKCSIDFTAAERKLYERLKSNTLAQIEEAYGDGGREPVPGSYINVIQKINAMRMMCNLGLRYDSRHETAGAILTSATDWVVEAQQIFDLQREMNPVVCSNCHATSDLTTAIVGIETHAKPLLTQCLRFFCSDCVQGYNLRKKAVTCGHTPPHPVAPVSLGLADLEGVPSLLLTGGAARTQQLSSKITALVSQLVSLPRDLKRLVDTLNSFSTSLTIASVVFSSWRMSLDLVEAGLQQAGISYLRYDGKVPQRQRQSVINKFRRDPAIKVFLLTLSCGAVG